MHACTGPEIEILPKTPSHLRAIKVGRTGSDHIYLPPTNSIFATPPGPSPSPFLATGARRPRCSLYRPIFGNSGSGYYHSRRSWVSQLSCCTSPPPFSVCLICSRLALRTPRPAPYAVQVLKTIATG